MIRNWWKRLFGSAAAARLPVLYGLAARTPAVVTDDEPIFDYTTTELFGGPSREPAWRPRWLQKLGGTATPSTPMPARSSTLARIRPTWFTAVPQRLLALPGYTLEGGLNGGLVPQHVRWAHSCSTTCAPVAIGGAPVRIELLRFFEPGEGLLPATVGAWTERAWQLAIGIEQRAHMQPLFIPDRFQVGFCCGGPELACEILPVLWAENLEVRLGRVHNESQAHGDPCDILLPLRPGATQAEIEEIISATVKATHTVLCPAEPTTPFSVMA